MGQCSKAVHGAERQEVTVLSLLKRTKASSYCPGTETCRRRGLDVRSCGAGSISPPPTRIGVHELSPVPEESRVIVEYPLDQS